MPTYQELHDKYVEAFRPHAEVAAFQSRRSGRSDAVIRECAEGRIGKAPISIPVPQGWTPEDHRTVVYDAWRVVMLRALDRPRPGNLVEPARRWPGWKPGVPIPLADGQVWSVPETDMESDPYRSLLVQLDYAQSLGNELVCAMVLQDLVGRLLSEAYFLAPEEIVWICPLAAQTFGPAGPLPPEGDIPQFGPQGDACLLSRADDPWVPPFWRAMDGLLGPRLKKLRGA